MTMDASAARQIADAIHLAWTKGDLPLLLSHFAEDIVYTCNVEGKGGELVVVKGRDGMEAFLTPIHEVLDSVFVMDRFDFKDGIGRASVACMLTHRATGHILSGHFRQVITYEDGLIAVLAEYHDAARIAAFWTLVRSPLGGRSRD